jgi:hypothetical protein
MIGTLAALSRYLETFLPASVWLVMNAVTIPCAVILGKVWLGEMGLIPLLLATALPPAFLLIILAVYHRTLNPRHWVARGYTFRMSSDDFDEVAAWVAANARGRYRIDIIMWHGWNEPGVSVLRGIRPLSVRFTFAYAKDAALFRMFHGDRCAD